METKTILLVEDEPIIAMGEAVLLRKEGYEVVLASSGEEAIATVESAPETITLILMDIDMGKGQMDGTEAAQEILKKYDIPVLFLSSHNEPEVVEKTEKITSYGYVVKGSSATVLAASIKMAFKLHAAYQKLQQEVAERKRAEDASRASEALLREAQRISSMGNWELDIKSNKPSWSEELFRIFEIEGERLEATHNTFLMVIHPDDRQLTIDAYLRSLETREPYEITYRLLMPDGRIKFIQEQCETVYDAEGQPLRSVGVVQDITERKRVEDVLALSQARFQAIFEHANDAIHIANQNNEIIAVNSRACELLGYSQEEFLKLHISDLQAQEYRAGQNAVQIELQKYGNSIFEGVDISKYGRRIPVEISVSRIESPQGELYVSILRDITERKQAEEALRFSNERYQNFISQSFEAISRTELDNPFDTTLPVEEQIDLIYENAYMAECNQAMADMYNLPSPEALIGMRLIDAHGGKDNPINRAAFRKFINNGYKSINDETQEYTPDGKEVWFLSNTVGKVENGQLVRLWGTAIDITARKQADEALRASEASFRSIFEKSASGYVLTAVDGKLLQVNAAMAKMLGYSVDELVQLTFRDITHPDDMAISAESVRSLLAGEQEYDTYLFEKRYLHRDGTIVWAMVNSALVRDAQNAPLYFVTGITDITDRKRTEEALRESERRYQLVFENSGTANSIFDVECRLVAQNSLSAQSLGVKPGDALGKTVLEIFGPERGPLIAERMQRVLQSGVSDAFETQFNLPTGAKWFRSVYQPILDEQGKTYGVQIVSQDITDHKQSEEKLQENERTQNDLLNKLNMAQRIAKIGSWDWNLQTNEVWWSDETYEIFGVTRAEYTPSFETNGQFLHPESLAEYEKAFVKCLETGQDLDFDVRLIMPSGNLKYCSAKGKVTYDALGKPLRFDGVIIDITEHKLAEDVLRQTLDEKDVLLRELQHRVKNSLTIAASMISLEEPNLEDERALMIFANVKSRIRSMASVYEQLYHTGRIDRINLGPYIEELAAELSKSYLPKSGPVKIETRLEETHIDLNRALPLGIILNELIINALKYAFPPGSVTPEKPGIILVQLSQADGQAKLQVVDNGIGISPDNLPNNGIGLELVKMLARQIGGNYTSHSDGGTTAQISFRID